MRNVLIFIRLTEPVFVALRYPKNKDDFDERIICERNVVPLLHGSAIVNSTPNDEDVETLFICVLFFNHR